MTGSLNLISEAYVLFLIEKLEDGCLNPVIREKSADHVTIRIDCPQRGKDCFITINLREWQLELIEEEEEESDVDQPETEIEAEGT